MSDSPYLPPRLTLRVGVTGHRPDTLAGADCAAIAARAGRILDELRRIVDAVAADDTRRKAPAFAEAPPVLRFATAIAEGAGRLLARVAADGGWTLNVLLPFRRDQYGRDFEGDAARDYRQWLMDPSVKSVTELDVSMANDAKGYDAVGRLLLDHSDVLIAVWDGEPGRGPGGTARVVEEARLRGLLVIHITLAGKALRWVVPEGSVDAAIAGRWQALDPVPGGGFEVAVRRILEVPDIVRPHDRHERDRSTPPERVTRFARERLRSWSISGIPFSMMRSLLLCERIRVPVDLRLDKERDNAWQRTLAAAQEIGGGDYRRAIDERLRTRWIGADNVANACSWRFRSAFTMNFMLAAAAVFFTTLIIFDCTVPAIGWLTDGLVTDTVSAKVVLVVLELAMIATILLITRRGHGRSWRHRWLDARLLAETLRPARLPILIGSSPARPPQGAAVSAGEAWISWYVRAALREIAPPSAVLGPDVLRLAADVAVKEEIDAQIRYHRGRAERNSKLDARLEWLALGALRLTILAGAVFLLAFLADHIGAMGATASPHAVEGEASTGHEGLAYAYKHMATFLGAILPVIGAAVFGIRAVGEFRAEMHQSERMLEELERMRATISTQRGTLDRAQTERLLGLTSRAMADDLQVWATTYSERELSPGF